MEHKTSPRVCVVIPAYNESAVVGEVIHELNQTFKSSPYAFTLLVVNDASRDNTTEVAEKAGAMVVTHIINQGAGGATSTGLRYALKNGFDIAVTVDADGQHHPEDALNCVTALIEKHADLLIGSRLIDARGMSKVKVIGNRGLSIITWLLFGVSVTDSQSGLRVFSKQSLQVLEWKSTGYEFCSEMIWRAKQAGLTVAEAPIKAIYTDYSKGKGQNNWNAINIIKSLVRRRLVEFFE